ncbi:MAG: hypothetical protein R3E97_16040 [Candidatus Eisenbacteria bacterium]
MNWTHSTPSAFVSIVAASVAVLGMTLSPGVSFGYEIDYDLSDFRTTDIHRSTLVLEGGINPSLSTRSRSDLLYQSDESLRSLFGSGEITFTRDIDLERRVGFYSTEFAMEGTTSSERTETLSPGQGLISEGTFTTSDATERRNSMAIRGASDLVQSYYRENRTFVGMGYELDYVYQALDQEIERREDSYPSGEIETRDSDERRSLHDLSTSFSGHIGWGRIYDVSYARKAIFILEGLGEAGLLRRTIDPATVERLGNLLRELENGRIFDFREKAIHDLREIVAFLERDGLLSDPGVEGIAIVDDNWTYARDADRGTGSRIRLEQGYRFAYRDDSLRFETTLDGTPGNEDDRREIDRRHSLATELAFVRQSPLSQRFQLSHTAELEREATLDLDYVAYRGEVGTTFGYYPNSRDVGTLRFDVSHQDVEDSHQRAVRGKLYLRETNGSVTASWQRLLTMRTTVSVYYTYRRTDQTTIGVEMTDSYTRGENRVGLSFKHYLL